MVNTPETEKKIIRYSEFFKKLALITHFVKSDGGDLFTYICVRYNQRKEKAMLRLIMKLIRKKEKMEHIESEIELFTKQYRPKESKSESLQSLDAYEKILCVVKGCALGDYAGQPFEARPPIDCDIATEDLYVESDGYTDDTVLTCATSGVVISTLCDRVADSDIPSKGKIDVYAEAYRSFAMKYPVVLGGYGSRFLSWVYTDDEYFSCGNGSAMRVSPCGCFDDVDTVIIQAYYSSICTHSHPEGIKGAVVTAVCVWMAFHGFSKKEIASYAASHYEDSPYSPNISFTKMESYEYFKGNPAVCQSTVPLAVSCFINSENYEDCIAKAIRFGWDTDTQAAIAGSIAAAYYRSFNESSEKVWRKNCWSEGCGTSRT